MIINVTKISDKNVTLSDNLDPYSLLGPRPQLAIDNRVYPPALFVLSQSTPHTIPL